MPRFCFRSCIRSDYRLLGLANQAIPPQPRFLGGEMRFPRNAMFPRANSRSANDESSYRLNRLNQLTSRNLAGRREWVKFESIDGEVF